eukprot:55137-Eustigmatos_ZCMA.PRE.2
MDQLLKNPLASYKSFLRDMSDDFMIEDHGKDFRFSLEQDNDMKKKPTPVKGKSAPMFDADVMKVNAYHFSLSGMAKELEVYDLAGSRDDSDRYLSMMDPDVAQFKLVKSGEYADEVYEYRLKERFGGKIPTIAQVGTDGFKRSSQSEVVESINQALFPEAPAPFGDDSEPNPFTAE